MADQLPPPMPWSASQKPPIGGHPIVLRPETFARIDRAVNYVQLMTRELPFTPHRGRTTGSASGVWGLLKPHKTVSGAHAIDVSTDDPPVYSMVLGTGKMEICFREPDDLGTLKAIPGPDEDADSRLVTVYNSGPGFTAGSNGLIYPMLWMDGNWFPIQIQPAAGFLAVANGAIPPRVGSQFGIGSVIKVVAHACYSCSSSSSGSSDSSFSSCSSGSGAGSCDIDGNCTMVSVQGQGNETFCVFNPSRSKMTGANGIDDGTHCWAATDPVSGLIFVTPLECA